VAPDFKRLDPSPKSTDIPRDLCGESHTEYAQIPGTLVKAGPALSANLGRRKGFGCYRLKPLTQLFRLLSGPQLSLTPTENVIGTSTPASTSSGSLDLCSLPNGLEASVQANQSSSFSLCISGSSAADIFPNRLSHLPFEADLQGFRRTP
jgi:hypothetical protein